jgi:hypothetical protein
MSSFVSRKFLLAVLAAVLFTSTGQPELAAAVVLGYIGVQGALDARSKD